MANQTFEMRNVPIFSVGTWNGDSYTESDLDHMVAAYNLVGFKPPVKLGHDESQPLAKSDSMPSIGWVTNLRRVGKQLYADITGLPRKVYEAIRRKNYDRVSAEVYWDYADGGGRKLPRVLKALALLGAEIPAVTDLDALASLYDASGKSFKRYDMGMIPSPDSAQQPVMSLEPSEPSDNEKEEEEEKKDKATVHYRVGGEDFDGDGDEDRCGGCRFWVGEPDLTGEYACVGACTLVEGDIGSTMLCDLYEITEAFQPAGSAMEVQEASHKGDKTKVYDASESAWNGDKSRYDLEQLKSAVPEAVRAWAEGRAKGNSSEEVIKGDLKFPYKEPDGTVNLNGVRAALAAMGGARTGKKPSDIPAEVIAKAREQLQGILEKHGGNPNTKEHIRTFSLPIETVKALCPSCADKMAFLNLKELKLTYDPATKTYSGFSKGLCDRFGDATGFRTRCMADDGKLSESVDDMGAFCNSLKEYCFGSVTAETKKNHSDAARRIRTMGKMQVEEKDGQFCVTAGGKDVQCFPTKDEADAYLETESGENETEMMRKQDAEIKALTAQLAAANAQVATLGAKVPQLEKYVNESEAEKTALRETARKSGNEQWLKSQMTEGNMKILPVEAPLVAHLLDQLTDNGGPTLKAYAAEEGKELSAVEAFKSIFERRKPGTLLFEEVSKGRGTETAGAPEAIEQPVGAAQAKQVAVQLAKKFMEETGEKSLSIAMKKVYAKNPTLKEMAAGVTPQGEAKADAGAEQMTRMFKR